MRHRDAGSSTALSLHCQVIDGVVLKVGHVVATAGADDPAEFIVTYDDLKGIVLASGTGPGHEETGVWCVWTVTL